MTTRTGSFPIGFRRGWSDWQKQDLKALAQWAATSGFEAIDLGRVAAPDIATLRAAGLKLGSADLLGVGQLVSADAGKRKEAVEQNIAYIREVAPAGAKVFFTVVPGDPSRQRAENYALAVEGFAPVAQAAHAAGASIAIEGWPGGSPHLANLCCTPETYRRFIRDVGPGVGINYDPSHLIRLQVDHIRFVKEFAPHVKHVHGKDTELDSDALYELGTQPAVFAKGHGFGEWTWRYTIPGHGCARWGEILRVLKSAGFDGIVSVELEDENFNTGEAGEKAGLLASLAFLRSA